MSFKLPGVVIQEQPVVRSEVRFEREYLGSQYGQSVSPERERERGRSQYYQGELCAYGIRVEAFHENMLRNPGKLIIGSIVLDNSNYFRERIIRGEYFLSTDHMRRIDLDQVESKLHEGAAIPIFGDDKIGKIKKLRESLVKESKELDEQYPDDKEISGCLDYAIDKIDELFGGDMRNGNET